MPSELIHAYRLYFPLLVRKCARMLGDGHEAEDVAQEAFLRLHDAGIALDDPRRVTAWLYRTSTRLAVDRLRSRARLVSEDHAFDSLSSQASPERQALFAGMWAELVRRLPEDELSAALLSHVDGLKQQEIAEVLGIHERSVRRLLVRFEERAVRLRTRSER
ncbi:MAG: RNA polymerase sigma factor [Myxococcales bacterium]